MSIQIKRKEKIYFKVVAQILTQKINNSNIAFTTVTDVKLSNDGSILTIYVIFEKNQERSFKNLLKTKFFVRSELAKISKQRIVPKIVFKYDKTIESARRIEKILKNIKNTS